MNSELTTTERQIQRTDEPLSPAQLVEQVKHIQGVMKSVMQEGQHFGRIPGCGPKPALFKPGAEKLQLTFRLHPDFEIHETDLPEGHKTFRVTCRMQNQSGGFQGAGVGYGSTKETKYAKGKQNPADFYNTALKMAKKRAQVDAVLTCTAASDIFTQDLEDMAENGAAPRRSETLPKDKFIEKKFPQKPPTEASDSPSGSEAWWGTIKEVKEHRDPTGKKDWVLYRINLEEDEEWTATTFDQALAKDAEIMIGQKVRVLIEDNKRKPGTFSYLGFEPIPEPSTASLWPEEPKEEAPF